MERVTIEIEATFVDKASGQAKKLEDLLNKIDKSKPKIVVDSDSTKAKRGITDIKKDVDNITKGKHGIVMDVVDNASGKLNSISGTLTSLVRRPFQFTVGIIDKFTSPFRKLFDYATSFKGLMTGIIAGQAGRAILGGPLALADQYESALIGFEGILGDQKKAQQFMKEVEKFATRTPFNARGVTTAAQTLMRMGVSDEKSVFDDLETIGNVVSSTGGGTEDIMGVARAFSEVISKDKLMGQELIQLANRGVNAKQYLKDAYGTDNFLEIESMNKKGLIDAQEAVQVILKGMKEDARYAGNMEKNANRRLSGLKEQIMDTFETKIITKWGRGLQDGIIPYAQKFLALLDKNEAGIESFGNKLQVIGSELAGGAFGVLENTLVNAMDTVNSAEFKNAGITQKIGLLWDNTLGDPLSQWWDDHGKGAAVNIAAGFWGIMAEGAGTFLSGAVSGVMEDGKDILKGQGTTGDFVSVGAGLLAGLKGFSMLRGLIPKFGKGTGGIPSVPGLPSIGGGSMTVAANIVYVNGGLAGGGGLGSGAIPLPGPVKAGLGGTIAGKLATIGGGSALAGGGAVVGGLAGITVALSGIKDVIAGEKYKGVGKVGAVGTGAMTGAVLGSAIPGIGTAIGAAVGAGLGGIGAAVGSDKLAGVVEEVANNYGTNLQAVQSATAETENLTGKTTVAAGGVEVMGQNAIIAGSALGALPAMLSNAMGIAVANAGVKGASTGGKPVLSHTRKIAAHADGGIFNTPHMAMFAEDGKEAVIPMTKSHGPAVLSETARQMGMGFGGAVQVSAPVSITISASDGADVVQQIKNNANEIADVISSKIYLKVNASKQNMLPV